MYNIEVFFLSLFLRTSNYRSIFLFILCLWWAIVWYLYTNQLYFLLAFTYRPCELFLYLFTFLFKWFDLCLHYLVHSYYNGLLFPNLHGCLQVQHKTSLPFRTHSQSELSFALETHLPQRVKTWKLILMQFTASAWWGEISVNYTLKCFIPTELL